MATPPPLWPRLLTFPTPRPPPAPVSVAAMAALGPPPVPQLFVTMEEGPGSGGTGPGEAWLEARGRVLGHWVDGSWLMAPRGEPPLECRERATGRLLAGVPRGAEAEVGAAVGAAAAAAAKWGRMRGVQRGRRLQRLAVALEGGAAALGAMVALGGGHPLAHPPPDPNLDLGLRLLRAAAGGAQLGPPGLEEWQPLGVVAVVLGGPCALPPLLWSLGAILAMGNTALVLSGVEAALPALLLGCLSSEGGALPPGVLNVVSGDPPALCRALRCRPPITAIAFLGTSAEEMQKMMWGSPGRGPRFWGVRGGRVIVIVLDSADLDSAAAAIVGSLRTPPALRPGGGCVVLAQESVMAPLERRLRARLGGLRLGDPPLHPQTDQGSAPHPEELLRAARDEGAEVFQAPLPTGGHCCPPTLISGVAPTSRCVRETSEAPLLPLLPVRCASDAVAVASSVPSVAAAAVWAQDISAALDAAERLPHGLVWLNSLEPGDPTGGAGLEVLREFGRPPWDPPEPPPEQELSSEPIPGGVTEPPETAEIAAAVEGARRGGLRWGLLPGGSRARVLRGAVAALEADAEEATEGLREALLRWAARAEMGGGAMQVQPGGWSLLSRRPLGVVGVAWSGPRPLPLALHLLPPALALGNGVVLVAPPQGLPGALRLRQALEAAGLPGGALAVLPGGSRGAEEALAKQRPDGLWLCGGGTVPLLLLLAAPPPTGCCSFDFSPISSTFSARLRALTPWLLLDYPVAMPGNLEADSRCSDLWGLHFGAAALGRMAGAAGGALAPQIRALAAHLAFVAECGIHDPQRCVRLETVNASQLLSALEQHLGGLRGRPPNFPGCARLRCRTGPPPARLGPPQTPVTPMSPPGPPPARLGPPEPPRHHGLVLLGGVVGGVGLAAAAWALRRRPCAQGPPESEQDGT
ncbi:LOW QUALITY PROTEIN: aldehyde dehydrogenase family 16 member A1 [Cuculus canorus]|uniref:LOW QUALITY PROTEIN: aldehyde dehydrogenase family 16 member A1 n=1 Tax=Cuculus canorus TaxID=55661 RepID=UPI0023AB1207|nr:LOW QUALITY PROTEIN: aldehyde dehydrogenase family 16 member A1 [Cuculus canorus]